MADQLTPWDQRLKATGSYTNTPGLTVSEAIDQLVALLATMPGLYIDTGPVRLRSLTVRPIYADANGYDERPMALDYEAEYQPLTGMATSG